jgi:UDP-N-acetylmuramoyl-tripeptide--D-alanyl-D-alanine ligase
MFGRLAAKQQNHQSLCGRWGRVAMLVCWHGPIGSEEAVETVEGERLCGACGTPGSTVPCGSMLMRASEIAAALGASIVVPPGVNADPLVTSVGFDSREIQPGSLFVALTAQRDGHQFIGAAAEAGAVACLQSQLDVTDPRIVNIVVPDTAAALMELARVMRQRLAAQVVGLTGSVGKTSTKDLILAAIGASKSVWGNERSFNNEQGLPVTILNAPDDAEVLVLEMGMRGHGQITQLCQIAAPQIGLVTNVGYAHTELVGGIEGVATAKGELIAALPSSGTAVLNADDPRVMAMAKRGPASVVTYGQSLGAEVRITGMELDQQAKARCMVETPWGRYRIELQVPGAHMALNAAAALAVTGVCGADLSAAAQALAQAKVSPMRMQVGRTRGGAVLVNDAYNANPTSMTAALKALSVMDAQRRVAVLGVMAELDEPEIQHREVAQLARDLGIELWPVGTELYGIAPITDPVAAIGELGESDAVLLKASRVAGLERIAHEVAAAISS